MQVLVHYTTHEKVFYYFNCDQKEITYSDQLQEVKEFYDSYYRVQEYTFFVISYFDEIDQDNKYCVGKITYLNNIFIFTKVSDEIQDVLLEELFLSNRNSYEKEIYYKTFMINDTTDFRNKMLSLYVNKIKLKYYDWDEVLMNNDIIFKKISKILFNRENVLKLATAYNPNNNYTDDILTRKCYSALKKIGFIDPNGIDTSPSNTVLQGDIGEFLMHVLVSQYLEASGTKYLYPKLILKSSPKMAVYGNDGAIYVPDQNIIYFMEAKFYQDLASAIDKAVESLSKHNFEVTEDLNNHVELFKNVITSNSNEILEIKEGTSEKFIIFAMCDNEYDQNDIKYKVDTNIKLNVLKSNYEVIIFVLPVLDKSKFLECFGRFSKKIGGDYDDRFR